MPPAHRMPKCRAKQPEGFLIMANRTRYRAGLPSQRQLRVGELVRKALSDLLTRGALREPMLESRVITIPEVRMTPDLRLALVYVMPLGGGEDGAAIVEALGRHRKWLRGQVARHLDIKFTPDLRFELDTRFDDDSRIDAILNSPALRRDLDDGPPPADPDQGA